MWPELKKEIAVEQESLERLLAVHHDLLAKCKSAVPDQVEISALSAMLHSFYTGVENLFKRIAVHVGGDVSHGEMWHSRLLDSMAEATQTRPQVINAQLRDCLLNYLNFRHVFRHAYTFELQWGKMASLVSDCENVYKDLKGQIARFVREMESHNLKGLKQ